MGKIAFVFSGQGAQHVGMGKDFYENNSSVRALFDAAEEKREGTLAQMFEGDEAELRKTENTQPCLYLADLAPAIALTEMGITAEAAAGFSLGEFPSLAFSGALSPIDCFELTVKRGKIMGAAASTQDAAMVAAVKLDNATVEEVCREFTAVYPVNYNCHGQLVVSGERAQIAEFSAKIKARGGLALPLKVSGGFHSPFMDEAAKEFAAVLEITAFSAPKVKLYANRTGKEYGSDIVSVLSEQMNHPVLWENTIKQMAEDGFDTFIETGVGNVLSKLIAKILPAAHVYTADSMEACEKIAKEVLENA